MYLGIDLGGTNLKAGIIDDSGELVFKSSQPTYAVNGPESVINEIKQIFEELVVKYPNLKSVGIGVPGVISGDGIIKVSPNLPGWIELPLKKLLLDKISLPIAIDNDANAGALAELELGSGRNTENFLYVTLGTGVGGTIIYNNEIFRGESGGAGEIGHTIIDANRHSDNSDRSYRLGALEEFIGRKKIIALALELLPEYPDSILNQNHAPDVSAISDAVYNDDPAAVACFRKIGELLGIGLASAMNLLGISVAIIGGGISMSHPLLIDTALETVKKRALPTIASVAELRLARFTKDAGVIGAAILGKKLI
jgi:glucokinase